MNKDQFLLRRQQSKDAFDELVKNRDIKQAELNEIESELLRLQGEYRLMDEVINGLVPDEATTINVDKELKKSKGTKNG